MILIDNNVDLFFVFEDIKSPYKEEISDLINFLKMNPDFKSFEFYKISIDSFKIFLIGLDHLSKNLS